MKVFRTHRITAFAAVALLPACTRGSTDESPPLRSESPPANPAPARGGDGSPASPAGGRGKGMMSGHGPVEVPGTTVTSTDIDGGTALVFTTRTGDVAELRRRVRGTAEMHNERLAVRKAMHGPPGARGRQHHGMRGGGMMMPAATASVEDVENGARIVFRPEDPAQLESLREAVRARAERMASGACPMMSLDEPPVESATW